ncbi:CHAT domain-containing protein [Desulfobacter curvatus]|uniref:CHAT domain-containing protein n=1 Tax=Desulfobacter curvatus TaxID=2290 RepID=UPI000360E6A6|nr:CHAT domain-containing protein [Desulfobacter curvatus]
MNSRTIHLEITKSTGSLQDNTIKLQISLREPPVWKSLHEETTVSLGCIDRFCSQASRAINQSLPTGKLGRTESGLLKDLGVLMCNELLPPTIKKRLRETEKKTLILTLDENLVHIPWELIYLNKQFLCLKFCMGRWVKTQWDLNRIARQVPTDDCKLWIIANPDGDLPRAGKEGLNIFRKCSCLENCVKTAPLSSEISRDELFLKLTDFDIIHFAGHVHYDHEHPSSSAIKLKDSVFKAEEFAKLEGGSAMPSLVFLNACQSAYNKNTDTRNKDAAFGLTDALIRSGVQHYIGTLWKVSDIHSSNFALNFYDYFFNGYSVGEAVNLARKKSAETKNDLSWASYVLYGDPQATYFSQTAFSPRSTNEENSPLPGEKEKIRNRSDEEPSISATAGKPSAKNKKRRMAIVALVCIITAGLLTVGRSYLQKAPDHWSMPVTMSVSVMEPSDETAKFAAHVLESQLHEKCPHIQLLERTDWQVLKQEYDIMSSRLVPRRNKITPELLTAELFLIIDVNNASNPPTLLMRLAETRTGSIKHNFNEPLYDTLFTEQKKRLCETVIKTLEKEYPLKGRIVKLDGGNIILNIGHDQGVRPGQRFEVVENGTILKIEKSDDIKARTSLARQEQAGNAPLTDGRRVRRVYP